MRFLKFINEAIIHINMEPINAKIKQIKKIPKDNFLEDINSLFNGEIYFIPMSNKTPTGIGRAGIRKYNNTYIIVININIDKIFKLINDAEFHIFALELSSTIEHELIHKEQISKISNKNIDTVLSKGKIDGGMKDYLKNEHELMAYANSIVRNLQHSGFDNEEILDMIRNPSNNITPYAPQEWSTDLERYLENFKDDPKVLKRLFKYMYQYIVGED